MKIDASDKNDLIKLCKKLNDFSSIEKAYYIAELHYTGLFKMKTNFIINGILKFVYKIKGYNVAVYYLQNLLLMQGNNAIDDIYAKFLYHIMYGTNTEDQFSSSGGFSQIEINMILSIFNFLGKE